jgi:hypothetical protein
VNILRSIFSPSPEVRTARGVLEELSYQLEQKQTSFIESAMFQTVKSKNKLPRRKQRGIKGQN